MSKTYSVTGYSRELMIFDKQKLYEIGGTREGGIKKWSEARKGSAARSHVNADAIAAKGSAVVLAVLLTLSLPAWAVPGKIVDVADRPVEGVKICHVVNGANLMCVATDSRGTFDLADSKVGKIRLTKEGYLPQLLDELAYGATIVIREAAEVWVKLFDADGTPIETGEVFLLFPTGERKGPFPVNAQGVRVRTLAPGDYSVLARSEGFVQQRSHSVRLVAGVVAEARVELVVDRVEQAPSVFGKRDSQGTRDR